MRKIFCLMLIVISNFIVSSCKKPTDINAKPLNCDTRWTKIFAQVHLAESALESEKNEVRDSMNKVYSEQIFSKNKITRIEFDSMYNQLVSNPQQFLEFYKCVGLYLEKDSTKN